MPVQAVGLLAARTSTPNTEFTRKVSMPVQAVPNIFHSLHRNFIENRFILTKL
jgi:hypothetical protein